MALPPTEEIRTGASKERQASGSVNDLNLVQSHVSHHDMPVTNDEFVEADAEQYLRFSPARKIVIVIVLSYCSFLAPISSTSILSGIPEVAKTYNTSGSVVNASNALYLAFMGVSAPFWGPFSQVWGRRPVSNSSSSAILLFMVTDCSVLDLPDKRLFVHCVQHRDSAGPESASILSLPGPHCLPRHLVPGGWQLCHWRCI